jgi:hypothetical protein
MKQHSIRLVGIVVFALCMAANADPNDFVFRAIMQQVAHQYDAAGDGRLAGPNSKHVIYIS